MKNSLRRIVFLISLLLVTQVQQVFAWGMTGHRVIAEIAERHLTKKAKKNIQKIIGYQKLAYWANWGDFIKSDPDPFLQSTSPWHYINIKPGLEYTAFHTVLQNSADSNLYKAYLNVKQAAKNNKNLTAKEKEQHLYFIIHLIGDAHQPMHVGRAEDLGGNRVETSFFGKKSNLHRVWDSDLVENEKYGFIEYADVLDVYNKKTYQQYYVSFAEVLYESYIVCQELYDDIAKNPTLSYTYIYKYKYIMEKAMLKAGIRLAKELNEIYG